MAYYGTEAILTTDAGVSLSTITHDGNTSLQTVEGNTGAGLVHLHATSVAATTGYMLIDLSDAVNWPHTLTGHIDVRSMIINVAPTTTFAGSVHVGFLTNVDGTNGDFNIVYCAHFIAGSLPLAQTLSLNALADMTTDQWFGPTTANDTTWQTDVNITGPDGNVSYPSGAGDLVMKVTRTASQADVSVTLLYTTQA